MGLKGILGGREECLKYGSMVGVRGAVSLPLFLVGKLKGRCLESRLDSGWVNS